MSDNNKKTEQESLPKRFLFGVWCRETQELFIYGWKLADKRMFEQKKALQDEEEKTITVELLERKLYDDGMKGDNKTRLEILQYFLKKNQTHTQIRESIQHRPVLLGDQITSVFNSLLFLTLYSTGLSLLILLTGNLACRSSNSSFCQNIHTVTHSAKSYFTEDK
jgi:hypothetical protein